MMMTFESQVVVCFCEEELSSCKEFRVFNSLLMITQLDKDIHFATCNSPCCQCSCFGEMRRNEEGERETENRARKRSFFIAILPHHPARLCASTTADRFLVLLVRIYM